MEKEGTKLMGTRERGRLDYQLSHLTYEREDPSPPWPPDLMRPLLLQAHSFSESMESNLLLQSLVQDERVKWRGLAERIRKSLEKL